MLRHINTVLRNVNKSFQHETPFSNSIYYTVKPIGFLPTPPQLNPPVICNMPYIRMESPSFPFMFHTLPSVEEEG